MSSLEEEVNTNIIKDVKNIIDEYQDTYFHLKIFVRCNLVEKTELHKIIEKKDKKLFEELFNLEIEQIAQKIYDEIVEQIEEFKVETKYSPSIKVDEEFEELTQYVEMKYLYDTDYREPKDLSEDEFKKILEIKHSNSKNRIYEEYLDHISDFDDYISRLVIQYSTFPPYFEADYDHVDSEVYVDLRIAFIADYKKNNKIDFELFDLLFNGEVEKFLFNCSKF